MSDFTTARHLRDRVRSGQQSAVSICEDTLARIEQRDSALRAFLTLAPEQALERAREIDAAPARWRDAPLAGVPIALKDNLCTRGIRTTASSKILDSFIPPFTATAVARLEAAGAVIVGKTNCDEFAMGSSTENSAYGPTRNPWDPTRVPGGSSGGSAVAVAACMAPLSLGSDTGGSIRQPAGHCGIVGLKPTYGRVSRYGLLAYASSLDQIGPFSHTVADAALALSVIAGADAADATSSRRAVPDFEGALTGDVRGLRIGVPHKFLESGIDPDVARAVQQGIDVLVARGAVRVNVDLHYVNAAIPVYYLIATAEASSNLARYDGVRYGYRASADRGAESLRAMYTRTRARGFGTEVKRRIMLGTYVLSAGYYDAYYVKAQQVRTLIRRDCEAALEQADVIAMPTSPVPAFPIGEHVSDPLQMYLTDIFTVTANLAGLPAISIPCGFTSRRLPIGLQFFGRPFDEATVLRVADAHERDTEWWKEAPAQPT